MRANLRWFCAVAIVLFALLARIEAVIKFTFEERLTVWLYKANIIRVTTLPNSTVYRQPQLNSLVVSYEPSDSIPYNKSTAKNNPSITVIETDDLYVEVNTDTLTVAFFEFDANHQPSHTPLLQESANGKSFVATTDPISHEPVYRVRQEWNLQDATSIYGFGMYQNGVYNLVDSTVRCVQFNTEICIPYLVTNQFYGIFWDSSYGAITLNSQNINISSWNITAQNASTMDNYNMSTTFVANGDTDGYYTFFIEFNPPYSFGAYYENDVYLWQFWVKLPGSDDLILHELFGPAWYEMPSSMAVKGIYLKKGDRMQIVINLRNITRVPSVFYRAPTGNMDIEALEADYIDYYFVYAPPSSSSVSNYNRMDALMSNYRLLTGGKIGLFALNVYGYWQSQNRYHNQSQLLSNAAEYRSRGIPIDNIVQDFKYWGSADHWGPAWNLTYYPQPALMVAELHSMNFHFMVSVWPRFGQNTDFYAIMAANDWLIGSTSWTNVYQQAATDQFYQFINASMFSIDVDYIWLDSSEPDNFPQINALFYDSYSNSNISGHQYVNPYSLLLLRSMYGNYVQHHSENKRPFFLTRSSYAAQQVTYSAVWSGDITSSWDDFKKQIILSLSYQLSGHAYIANDIGGFYRPTDSYDNLEYKRLLIRWFQFGCFLPIYRVHGSHVQTAIWNYGDTVTANVLLMHHLRYRLLPYIYSLAYLVTESGYTMQRALLFDFADDAKVYGIYDQFMFGPTLLVSPVYTDENATDVYLPGKYKTYYDFWTGHTVKGGQWMYNMSVALDTIPVYAHSGSLLVMGPFVQYSTQIPWTELEIRIYPGEDVEFTLFEDDFEDRLSIEKDEYTLITFAWNEATNEISISDRKGGGYDGMIQERLFNFVLVSVGHGVGVNMTANPDASVVYNGTAMTVKMQVR